jgi:hypothetical protein
MPEELPITDTGFHMWIAPEDNTSKAEWRTIFTVTNPEDGTERWAVTDFAEDVVFALDPMTPCGFYDAEIVENDVLTHYTIFITSKE